MPTNKSQTEEIGVGVEKPNEQNIVNGEKESECTNAVESVITTY